MRITGITVSPARKDVKPGGPALFVNVEPRNAMVPPTKALNAFKMAAAVPALFSCGRKYSAVAATRGVMVISCKKHVLKTYIQPLRQGGKVANTMTAPGKSWTADERRTNLRKGGRMKNAPHISPSSPHAKNDAKAMEVGTAPQA
mmetsp:Transcript_68470/g.190970  ORF Transcript_68470/g.190970 Transcript_68470/m.190970 type:complete len:145 (-) Transcript_68470:140-574(-)